VHLSLLLTRTFGYSCRDIYKKPRKDIWLSLQGNNNFSMSNYHVTHLQNQSGCMCSSLYVVSIVNVT